MAVGRCSECGGTVSDRADRCPHCGVVFAPVRAAPPARAREPITGWLSAVGGLLLLLSAPLPWLGDLVESQLGYRVPLALVWDLEAPESWLSVGLVVGALGVLVIATAFLRRAWPVRQVAGALALAVAVGVAVQIARFATAAGVAVIDSLNGLSLGFYLATAGGLIALLGPLARPKVARRKPGEESAEEAVSAAPRVRPAASAAAEPIPALGPAEAETAPGAAIEPAPVDVADAGEGPAEEEGEGGFTPGL